MLNVAARIAARVKRELQVGETTRHYSHFANLVPNIIFVQQRKYLLAILRTSNHRRHIT